MNETIKKTVVQQAGLRLNISLSSAQCFGIDWSAYGTKRKAHAMVELLHDTEHERDAWRPHRRKAQQYTAKQTIRPQSLSRSVGQRRWGRITQREKYRYIWCALCACVLREYWILFIHCTAAVSAAAAVCVWLCVVGPILVSTPGRCGPRWLHEPRTQCRLLFRFFFLFVFNFFLVPLLCCFIRLLSMRVQIANQTHTHAHWYSMYSRMFYTRLMWIVLSCYNIVYRRKKEEEETKLASQKQRLAMTKRTLSRHAHRQECTSHHHHHRPSSSSSLSYRTFFLAQQNKKYSIRERVYRPLQRFLNLDRNFFADNTDTGQFNGRPPHRICYDKSSPCDRDILKYSQIELWPSFIALPRRTAIITTILLFALGIVTRWLLSKTNKQTRMIPSSFHSLTHTFVYFDFVSIDMFVFCIGRNGAMWCSGMSEWGQHTPHADVYIVCWF